MAVRVIKKSLAGSEDLLLGFGTEVQVRNDKNIEITKINAGNIPYDETKSISEFVNDTTKDINSITKKVDTLADMRTMSELPETVWCSGYHTKNDGAFGSHFFRLKGLKTAETDNSGTVIIVNVGGSDYVYELQYSGAVNVKWFGAVGDGVTDDFNPLQSAINYCNTSTISKKIYVPFGVAGIYKITGGLIFSVGGITMEFENNSIVLKKYYGSSIVGYGNAIVIRAAYITLINIGIDGNGSVYDGGGIVVLDAPTYFTYSLVITNPRIFNTKKSCIEFSGIQAGSGCTISGGTLLTYNESGASSNGYPAIRKINEADTDACPRIFTDINSSSTPLIDLTGMVTTFIKGGQCATILFGGNPDVTGATFISAKAIITGVRIRDGVEIKGEDHSLSANVMHGFAPQYLSYGVLGIPLTYGVALSTTSKNCSLGLSNIVANKIFDYAQGLGDIGNKYFTTSTSYNMIWKGSITNPSIGNGTIASAYTVSGKTVKVSIYIAMGTTTTFGSGNYTFTLPYQIDANIIPIGQARVFNQGVNGAEWGMVFPFGFGSPARFEIFDISGTTFSPTVPHTFKAHDFIWISFEYSRL